MSARAAAKALDLRLDPSDVEALSAYARANGDRSLAAAVRRAVRADLALVQDAPPLSAPRRRSKRLRVRVQLEPALRAALAGTEENASALEPAVRAALARRIRSRRR